MSISVDYDAESDVLYLKELNAIINSKESTDDLGIFVNYDLAGNIVGYQIIGASDFSNLENLRTICEWHEIPKQFQTVIISWAVLTLDWAWSY